MLSPLPFFESAYDATPTPVSPVWRLIGSPTGFVDSESGGLLTKDQEPAWPKVELAERRNRLLRFQPVQMIQGIQIDFREILETTFSKPGVAKPDGAVQGAIDQALAAYEAQMDEQAKIAIPLDDAFRSDMIVTKPSQEQMDRQMKLMTEGMAIGGKIQTATDTAAKALAGALASTPEAPAARPSFIWASTSTPTTPSISPCAHRSGETGGGPAAPP